MIKWTYYYLGEAYEMLEDYEEAYENYNSALELSPDSEMLKTKTEEMKEKI